MFQHQLAEDRVRITGKETHTSVGSDQLVAAVRTETRRDQLGNLVYPLDVLDDDLLRILFGGSARQKEERLPTNEDIGEGKLLMLEGKSERVGLLLWQSGSSQKRSE